MELLPGPSEFGLKLSQVQESEEVIFVGFKIKTTVDGVRVQLADKQEKIPFTITRYPHREVIQRNGRAEG